jgi:hypothetical protein
MSGYAFKVWNAVLIIVIAAIITGAVTGTENAILVAVCGAIFILNRHICRCQFCGSWRTARMEHWVAAGPGSVNGVTHEERHCYRCCFDEPLGDYPATMWEQRSRLFPTDYDAGGMR